MKAAQPGWQGVFKQANIADLLILGPFAIPLVADHYMGLWRMISEIIAPVRPLGSFSPDAMLFVNLAGAFAVLSVIFRMAQDSPRAALMTGAFKLCAAAIFAIALLRNGSFVFVVPLLADLVVGSLLIATSRKWLE